MSSEQRVLYLCVNFPVKLDDDIFDGYVFEISNVDSDYLHLLKSMIRVGALNRSYSLVKNDTFSSRKVEY